MDPRRTTDSTVVTIVGDSAEALRRGFKISVDAFWDGGTTWKFRFNPPYVGRYKYTVSSTDANMNGASGYIRCLEEQPDRVKRLLFGDNGKYAYYLRDESGRFIFYVGDTQWMDWSDSTVKTIGQFDSLVAIRNQQGFHSINVHIGEANNPTKSLGGTGILPFAWTGTAYDPDNLNPTWWQNFDVRMDTLNQHNMIFNLCLQFALDGAVFTNWTQTQLERWAFYTIARYGAYPIFWIGMCEYNEDGTLTQWESFFDYWHKHDPWHNPLTAHTSTLSSGPIDESLYLDAYGMQYKGTADVLHDTLLARKNEELIPIFNLEFGYEVGSKGQYGTRQYAIDILKDMMGMIGAGAFGAVYGHDDIWFDGVVDSLYALGAKYMSRIGAFFNNFGFPFWEVDTYTEIAQDVYEMKKNDRIHFVLCAEDIGPFTVDLSHFTTNNLEAKWFSVQDSVWTTVAVQNVANQTIDAPLPGSIFVAYYKKTQPKTIAIISN